MSARALLVFLLAIGPICGTAAADETEQTREQIVTAAIAAAGSVPARADALARLAWPAEAGDVELAALARQRLVEYGMHAIPGLRKAIQTVKPEHQSDVVTALLQAYARVNAGIPPDYLPGLEEAVWFGTREARLVAIPELARFGYHPALLTIMDAALEDPGVLAVAIRGLARIGDDRARFFLEKLMVEGEPGIREAAAVAMAQIGGRATLPLKAAMRSEDRDLRLRAVRALLPAATDDDLSALHEYVYTYPEDDPETTRVVRESALALEKLLSARESTDDTSPLPD